MGGDGSVSLQKLPIDKKTIMKQIDLTVFICGHTIFSENVWNLSHVALKTVL